MLFDKNELIHEYIVVLVPINYALNNFKYGLL